ncbi:hypothetical protein G7Z17_g6738 [Cylindrodendrum hubeiense]|uniref:Uncharacterized protein n=1 Tax=Cylindrodendrum hubeiense TaxID=595255 RepID=A0A9P5HAD1_9HYPO|nr:hypothetical protein G7Z17_g6738 [Cylindrodendrum hubeiense]
MPNPELYRVFKLKFKLAMQDPDMPQPRYHTIIFVETNIPRPGSGFKHHVTGDIVNGMQYESVPYHISDQFEDLASQELIGHAKVSKYPTEWDSLLRTIQPPPKQKAFNIKTMKTEPVKSWAPLRFYQPGESRTPLIKCTEWVEQEAIQSLISQGLIETGSPPS